MKDPFGPLAFIVYLLIMEYYWLLVKVASSNFFVNDYYCGSRGQLVPLFRDLDDDGGQAKSCWITTKIS